MRINLKNGKNTQMRKRQDKTCKELVGLVFEEDSKLSIQVLDKKVIDRLERKKYTIKI